MAKPKQASDDQAVTPKIIVEDSVAPTPEPVKPQKTETKEVNGHEMTFEDY